MKKNKRKSNKFKIRKIMLLLFIISISLFIFKHFQNINNTVNSDTNINVSDDFKNEEDGIVIIATVSQFLSAKNLKKNELLKDIVSKDYYDVLMKNYTDIKTGDIYIQNIYFKEIQKDMITVEAIYNKENKKYIETINFKKENNTWKVINNTLIK